VARQEQPFNPFYAALVVVGVAFTITACAYALLMVRAAQPVSSDSADFASTAEETGLMKLLDTRGMEILGVEVLLLALATVGAIGLDQYRSSRNVSPRRGQTQVAGSEAPGLGSSCAPDPEGVKRNPGSTPSGSTHKAAT
jgi:hypothetical protein